MTTVDSIPHGRFCWVELAARDQAAAKTFYQSLFGWGVQDSPMGPDAYYTRLKLGDRDVGGPYTLTADQNGVPPHWALYVAVAEADDTVRKAEGRGGSAAAPAFDVMELGRMAILKDPGGAHLPVWQARAHKGFGVVNEPGAFCWGELWTNDPAQAQSFYTGLFGWGAKPDPKTGYTEWTDRGESFGGMLQIQPEWGPVPPGWGIYFQVLDCDKTAARVRELGGQVKMEPRDISETGRFAVLVDPQGAVFQVIALR
jgi:predicted enzyme related to lactoylglutathione lyase